MTSGQLLRRFSSRSRLRVGWVAAGTLEGWPSRFREVPPPVSMRICNNARWMNRYSAVVQNEMYRPNRRYDIVVFFKAMDGGCQNEAARIKAYGGRVVFDANVNYYEIWGDYDIEATEPTEDQQADAIAMTRLADWVVADSTYLLEIVRELNPHATWIPDNVGRGFLRRQREHGSRPLTRLVWSGVAKKAQPLLSIADALASLRACELVLVSDGRPQVFDELSRVIPCHFVRFTERRYASTLGGCDLIVSPKRLVNGYELGHTEYKITLGMAAGLPAVASPQQSYIEAVSHRGGGIIARSDEEWRNALDRFASDPDLRRDVGGRARQTVLERYATPVTARAYLEVLCSLG